MPRKKKVKAEPALRSRVKEFRLVKASEIRGAPWNFRTHPEFQRTALQGSIEELGFLDPLDCRECDDGSLELFDGHARLDLVAEKIGPDTLIPCNITDLTEAEAKLALTIKDQIASEALLDRDKLDALLKEVEAAAPGLQAVLDKMAAEPPKANSKEVAFTASDIKARFAVMIECGDESQQVELLERFLDEGLACRALTV